MCVITEILTSCSCLFILSRPYLFRRLPLPFHGHFRNKTFSKCQLSQRKAAKAHLIISHSRAQPLWQWMVLMNIFDWHWEGERKAKWKIFEVCKGALKWKSENRDLATACEVSGSFPLRLSIHYRDSRTSIYLKGWQIAMYRSHVNDVIVRIVALVDVSDSRPCSTQMVSSNGYELGSQMFIKSNGIPLRRRGARWDGKKSA